MVKIGVVSLGCRSTRENYGAIIQMWAFSKILKKVNPEFEVEMIDYQGKCLKNLTGKYTELDLKRKRKGIVGLLNCIISYPFVKRRYDNIEAFLNKHCNVTLKKYKYSELKNYYLDYDYLFAESDVIWDPSFRNSGFDEMFFLNVTAKESCKKFVYGASAGNCDFSEEQKKKFLSLIKELDDYSLREAHAAEYIAEFTKSDIKTVLDPTLLLEKKDYIGLIGSRPIREKYIFMYFPSSLNKKALRFAKAIAQKNNYKIIAISRSLKDKMFVEAKITCGIEDFLTYLNYAELVVCDSFHGVCLSYVLQKEFYAFPRNGEQKIKAICDLLGLPERFIDGDYVCDKAIEYDEDFLQGKRAESMKFIKDCFDKNRDF